MFNQAYWNEPLLKDLSKSGRYGYAPRINDEISSDIGKIDEIIPTKLRRSNLSLPKISQPQLVRHFTRLSQMNFSIDLGIYPLGSCTMKHNPKLNERLASDSRLKCLHPYQPLSSSQGILKLLYDLSNVLGEVTGLPSVSLSPAAGAHGEFVGVLIIKSWIKEKNESETRTEMLVPDSAHGTNPATASLAGFKVVKVPSDNNGLVDVDSVKRLSSDKTAGLMLTNPNTLGLFEKNIEEISNIVHEAGGLMYYDGANMNALLGKARPGDMGFDIAHLNLHKTFTTPHGGGGPGAGPVCVSNSLSDFLPSPMIVNNDGNYSLNYNIPKTIGRVKAFYGNLAILFRAYSYICLMGSDGLNEVSSQAVLAANYLLSKLNPKYVSLDHIGTSRVMHEFVISLDKIKSNTSRPALEIGKALLDYGVHSPTVYFPLTVNEGMMIEPTETESKEDLDQYANHLNSLFDIATTSPDSLLSKPQKTSIGRLDEANASRVSTMKLNWSQSSSL